MCARSCLVYEMHLLGIHLIETLNQSTLFVLALPFYAELYPPLGCAGFTRQALSDKET